MEYKQLTWMDWRPDEPEIKVFSSPLMSFVQLPQRSHFGSLPSTRFGEHHFAWDSSYLGTWDFKKILWCGKCRGLKL